MSDCDFSQTWYHGSQQKLTELRVGSSITQIRDLAKAFSHRPSLVSRVCPGEFLSDDYRVKHNGVTPGFLYTVSEEIGPEDIYPHPHAANADGWEWLTRRELKLKFIEKTIVSDHERLTDEDITEIRRKQRERGEETFSEESD
ncbi:MAG: hypothetical protein OXR72_02935 [Gemmatimonadota bacterium]|nr:hypothetical protein [Gemmatimonadota bacterium]